VGQGCSIVSNWRRFSFHFRWQNASKCLKVTLARQMSGVMGGWVVGVLGVGWLPNGASFGGCCN